MDAGNSIASSVKLRQRTCCVTRDTDGGPAASLDEAGGAAPTESGLNPASGSAASSLATAASANSAGTDSIDSDEACSAAPAATAAARRKVAPCVWSPEEKSAFFDALKLYGKNFMEISRCMRLKVRRTADASPKTRNQVKVFYQRTWQSIRNFLTFDDAVRPAVRELYGLINYGHFRKYLVGKKLNARHGEQLNELVHNGATRIRVRGKKKSLIVRSPVCPALRRLNQIQGPRPDYQFPDSVLLDLVPRTGLSFARVQAAGQNPRVRAKVSLNRQLFDALDAVRSKWRTAAVRLREGLGLPARRDWPCLTAFLPEEEENGRVGEENNFDDDPDNSGGGGGAELVTSVSKSKVKDIALEAYLTKFSLPQQQQQQQQDQQQQDSESEQKMQLQSSDGQKSATSGPAASASTSASASSSVTPEQVGQFRLDLRQLLARLRQGVTLEESRGIRLLALYLALGCPTVIRLEYEYLSMADLAQRETGITNTMRRLFHLAAHELNQQRERVVLETENSTLKNRVEALQAQTVALRDQVRELQRIQKQQQQQQQQQRDSYICCRCLSASGSPQLDSASIAAASVAASAAATASLTAAATTAACAVTAASGVASTALVQSANILQGQKQQQQQQATSHQQQQQQFQVPQPCSTSRLQMRQVSLLAGKRSISAVQRQLRMGSAEPAAAPMPPPLFQHLHQQQQQQQQQQQHYQHGVATSSYEPSTAIVGVSADDSLTGLLDELNPAASHVHPQQQHPHADDDNANFASLPASSRAAGNSTPRWEPAGGGPGLAAGSYSVSPLKTPQRVCESSRDSFTMGSVINAVINEDTAEYVDKFAQLMHEINSDNGK